MNRLFNNYSDSYKMHKSYSKTLKSSIKRFIFDWKRRLSTQVLQASPFDNIYYCCTQKTASQWLKRIFNDVSFYQYTGLVVYPYEHFGLRYASFNKALPKRTIGTHLYFNYLTYFDIPKPSKYKTFFILRDPRDIVVSFYFSFKYSHSLIAPIVAELRQNLENINFDDGLKFVIDKLSEFGLFEAQKSWIAASSLDRDIKIFRYEDIAADNQMFLENLFSYLNISMPNSEFLDLCSRHEFKKMVGREQGSENIKSHYRKGVSGDWKIHFNQDILDYFKQSTGDLLQVLSY